MEKRDRLDATTEILRIAMTGAKKTRIRYKANLNHAILGSYLDRLKENGLVIRKNKPES